ncbi:hypothetical protein F2P56_010079 [Juglans regia]|uniref:Retrotransposon Copia-like N-terminal domain-containing protein n=1 Tax=Juglans regia TaxID=51240 RepID=A0A834D0W0_JUGRE|nr:hypothetical protein F2P56_010079 [Juglans regia]
MTTSENTTVIPTSSPPPSIGPTIIHSSTYCINIKLTHENYLLWKAQIVSFLKGHHLFGFVDGSHPPPPSVVNNLSNPDHHTWVLQDQLIISTINASLSDSILTQVLNCNTSHEVWHTLETMFSAQSSAHIMQTKFQLATLKKRSDSITTYFNKATALASTLGAVGYPLPSSDFVTYLLAGLGSDLNP